MLTHFKKILVIDDEQEFARTISRHLKREGFSVYTAYDAESAMDKIQATGTDNAPPFDLIITDVVMPGISGIELLKWLHEHHPGIPVLVISGLDLSTDSEKELHPIHDYFRKKPLTPDLMMDAIQRIERKKYVSMGVAV